MPKFYPTFAFICAAVFSANSTQTSPSTGNDRVAYFLDQICTKLGAKWSSPLHAGGYRQFEERAQFVRGAEFHLLSTIFDALNETDFQSVVNATQGQIIDHREEGNFAERRMGLNLPMLFAVFRYVFDQYQSAKSNGHERSDVLSQWLVDALELVRPVNEFMSAQKEQNSSEVCA